MNKVNYILTARTVTVNYDNLTHTFDKGTVEFDKIVQCLKDKNFDDIPSIINASLRLKKYSDNNFYVENGVVMMDGEELPSQLSDRILSFEKDDLPYQPLINFWNRLKSNPSYRARHQLFSFLEHNGHPITDDGFFIAYKGVTSDFKDCHTKTIDNSVGNLVRMDRKQVDDDPNHTCSSGLHVASYNYAHSYYGGSASGVTVEVQVDPAHVVAVPIDYNGEKMRVCEYRVIGISKGERSEQYVPYNYLDDGEDEYEDEDDYYGSYENLNSSSEDSLFDSKYEDDIYYGTDNYLKNNKKDYCGDLCSEKYSFDCNLKQEVSCKESRSKILGVCENNKKNI